MATTTVAPRYLPTLTDVVVQVQVPVAGAHHLAGAGANQPTGMGEAPELSELSQDQLANRIMQRVDVVLERRLREAFSKVILEHTQALAPLLRDEIELVVKESITQALARH